MADFDVAPTGASKIRVHELAKQLGTSSKDVLTALSALGEPARSASSTVAAGVAARVRAHLGLTPSDTADPSDTAEAADGAEAPADATPPAADRPARAPRRRGSRAAGAAADTFAAAETPAADTAAADTPAADTAAADTAAADTAAADTPAVKRPAAKKTTDRRRASTPSVLPLFVAPEPVSEPGSDTDATEAPRSRRRRGSSAPAGPPAALDAEPAAAGPDLAVVADAEDSTAEPEDVREAAVEEATGAARRRRRRGRRGRGGASDSTADGADADSDDDATPESGATDAAEDGATDREPSDQDAADSTDDGADGGSESSTRRRRRRRRSGSGGGGGAEATDETPAKTSSGSGRTRQPRDTDDDGVRGVKGSTRLEAKRQRRRDGRETSRRRPPILTEAEFLARRESVDRVMAVRQSGDRTQIGVLEDGVLVEHYVTRASATSYVGNIYLGRVQNVLPSMEAAFVDIGKGRNGVLYAGEVNWDAAGLEGKSRAIENAMKSGDPVLVQVTKDPIGHKGARLTSQISLPGRFLIYVPGGGMTGISRRLPDTERHRLKAILKKIVAEDAGVIVRTAAESATEEQLTRDVERLQAQWATISKKAEKTSAAPSLLYGEPDLATRVVRDVFNEDFHRLIVEGEQVWQTVADYVGAVAPDLAERVSRYTGEVDLFHDLRIDEQLAKALDRKVWLPSGGSLIIDRTEAMTVIDVNTGKFVGAGGNLEQTVTRNNLEAAEEIVRQLRLRDVGGIVVIDFIDMVLESNRELVLRRLTECLGRDRTKHQVAEVTSLGLVQMTRKRVGEGLLEAFSEPCEHCHGRGVIVHSEPVALRSPAAEPDEDEDRPGRSKSRRRRGAATAETEPLDPAAEAAAAEQRARAQAAIAAIHRAADHPADEAGGETDGERDGQTSDGTDQRDDAAGPDGAPEIESLEQSDSPMKSEGEGEVDSWSAVTESSDAESLDAESSDAPTTVAAEPKAVTGSSTGRRRRRAAVRPAGPPVAPVASN